MELKHLKLLESGFTKATGNIGGMEFVDGVSVDPLTPSQASRISASMRAEFVDGGNSSAAGLLVSEKDTSAEVVQKMEQATEAAKPKTKTSVDLYLERVEKVSKVETVYSRADLEFIADEDGIAELRKVAAKFDVKGKSIAQIIDGVLRAQG